VKIFAVCAEGLIINDDTKITIFYCIDKIALFLLCNTSNADTFGIKTLCDSLLTIYKELFLR